MPVALAHLLARLRARMSYAVVRLHATLVITRAAMRTAAIALHRHDYCSGLPQ